MKKIYLSFFLSVFLSACGSSDNDFVYSDGPVADIQGDWITNCRTQSDGSSSLLSYTFDTSRAGNDFFVSGFSTYATSDCSGSGDITILAGDVFYDGEQGTTLCIAEQIDLFVTSADDEDGNTYEGADLTSFLDDNEISDRSFDLACAPNNRLFLGLNDGSLDGSSSANRPDEMDTSIIYYPARLGSSRAAKSEGDHASYIETAKSRMKTLLNQATAE